MVEHLTIPRVIRELDLDPIRQRLVRKKGWDADRAGRLIEEYREYLALFYFHPDEELVPPSQDLDDVWHEHILDTQKYAADCERVFGRFIHHVPGLDHGSERHVDGLHRTRKHWWTIFGRHRKKQLTVAHGADGQVNVVSLNSGCSGYMPPAEQHSTFFGHLFDGGRSGGAGASESFDTSCQPDSGSSSDGGSCGDGGGGDGGGGGGGCGGGGGGD